MTKRGRAGSSAADEEVVCIAEDQQIISCHFSELPICVCITHGPFGYIRADKGHDQSAPPFHAGEITSIFALSTSTSGVRLYSSSIKAARNVPGPLTSDLAAATSAAMVMTSTLFKSAVVLHHQTQVGLGLSRTDPAKAPISISPWTSCDSSSNGSWFAR